MIADRLEKIKALIETSPLLTKTEREDWAGLLELMNDKQILELEKILSNAPQPSLSHIMNFPGSQPSSAAKPAPPAIPQKPAAAKASEQPKSARFDSWLKSAVTEKELPAPGKHPLELMDHPRPPIAEPKPLTAKPAPAVPDVSALLLANHKADEEAAMKVRLPEKPAAIEKPKAISFAPPMQPRKPAEQRKTGLINMPQNFYETGAVSQTAAPITPKLSPAIPIKSAPVIPVKPMSGTGMKTGDSLALNNLPRANVKELSALTNLNLHEFRQKGAVDISALLRSGIELFGYHKAMEALEHSLLYAAYIDTGLKLLSEGKSFEEYVEAHPADQPRLFSRGEFENFTDMLRKIPAMAQK